jgi:hypothetical protein
MRQAMMKQRMLFASEEACNGAFWTPPRRVCSAHEYAVFSTSRAATKRVFRQVFLDMEWVFVYSNSPEMVADSLADGGALRAFFYSKRHARCLSEDGGWWRCVGHFI